MLILHSSSQLRQGRSGPSTVYSEPGSRPALWNLSRCPRQTDSAGRGARERSQRSGPRPARLGRNTVIGPAQKRVDASPAKMTKVGERTSLEFRAEFYNILNTAVFRPPERDMPDSSFGEIERTRGGPRVIQLGMKLIFRDPPLFSNETICYDSAPVSAGVRSGSGTRA